MGNGLDPSFGIGGTVTTDTGANVYGTSLVLQPDGKLVVAGYAGAESMVLARYTSSGTLDTEFGTQGVVVSITGSLGELARQPDGKIVAAGGTGWRSSKVAMVRYNSDGSIDAGFGTSGTLLLDLGRYNFATSLVLQPDHKIIIAGSSSERMFVARATVSGTLDTSFNSTGIVTTALPGKYLLIWDAALQSTGKIVVAGEDASSATNILLARYTPTGTLDASFGTDGTVITSVDSGTDRASSLVIQPDDKIVIGGVSYSDVANRSYFMAARYFPGGALDATFGFGGVVTSSIDLSNSAGSSVAVQPDGKVVLSGYSSNDDLKNNLAVARYLKTTFTHSAYLPLIQK